MRFLPAMVLCAGLAGCAAPPSACHVEDVADLPVSFTAEGPAIPVSLKGHPLNMLVDTGAEISVLTPQTAQALNIPDDFSITAAGAGVNGTVHAAVTVSQSLTFGRVSMGRAAFLVAGLGNAGRPGDVPVDGLIGNDILQQFAIALDFPDHEMTLMLPGNCAEIVPPWPGRFSIMPFSRAPDSSPVIPIAIDGQVFNVVVDSGADTTFISAAALSGAGVLPEKGAPSLQAHSYGLGGLSAEESRQVFATMTVGGETFAHPLIMTGESKLLAKLNADGLLGEDYLRHRKVFINNLSDKIYLGFAAGP